MNSYPGWMLIAVGAALLVTGLIWTFAPAVPLGRLPGDLHIEIGGTQIYIPITSCIVISLALSAVLWIVRYFAR